MGSTEAGFSVFTLIGHASFGVQFIMLVLLAASIVSWKLIFEYNFKIKKVERELKIFNKDFIGKDKKPLPVIFQNSKPMDVFGIFIVFKRAFIFFNNNSSITTNKKRDNAKKEDILNEEEKYLKLFNDDFDFEIERVEQGLKNKISILGTISSTSPYVGLLGTVYGILIAFWNLGTAQQATIATVAPSIAEALIATGMGLFVAIPSLIAYNRLNHRIDIILDEYDKVKKTSSLILRKHLIKGLEDGSK